MKYKYILGSWFCILFFANIFAQADTLQAAAYKADTARIIVNDSTAAATTVVTETKETASSKSFVGAASYYAKKFEGRKTATGETFRHANYTAASNTFKLNTWVKVTNIKNGKYVVVRINDRMAPSMSKKGRIVDLTYSAAKEIGIIHSGVGKVKVEVTDKPAEE